MNAGTLLFVVCSIGCLLGALSVVAARNPIRSAMGLLATIVSIAGLFLRLNAEFLAAIQLIVYAGAVVVLFVFVIMLLGPTATVSAAVEARTKVSRLLAAGLLAVLGIGALSALAQNEAPQPFGPAAAGHGTVEAVGGLIFDRGLVPFEIVTALLLVAAIGALAVARVKPSPTEKKAIANPTLRMFHGPLLPRDAGRPLSGESLAEEHLARTQAKEGA